jgi:hypothetical protein
MVSRTKPLGPTALLSILRRLLPTTAGALVDLAETRGLSTLPGTNWLLWCQQGEAAAACFLACQYGTPLWEELGGGGLNSQVGTSAIPHLKSWEIQQLGTPSAVPPPSRMLGSAKRPDRGGPTEPARTLDMEMSSESDEEKVSIPHPHTWNPEAVQFFNRKREYKAWYAPLGASTRGRILWDESYFEGHREGKHDHLCSLNALATVLCPPMGSSSGLAATTQAALYQAVIRHFSGTEDAACKKAKLEARLAITASGDKFSTPSTNSRLNLSTLYACMPATTMVLAPSAITDRGLQLEIMGRVDTTPEELRRRLATTRWILWVNPADQHANIIPMDEGTRTGMTELLEDFEQATAAAVSTLKIPSRISLLCPSALPVWMRDVRYGDSSRSSTPLRISHPLRDAGRGSTTTFATSGKCFSAGTSLPTGSLDLRPFRPQNRCSSRRELRRCTPRPPKTVWIDTHLPFEHPKAFAQNWAGTVLPSA